MTQEPGQENKDVPQESPLHKTWVRLAIASVVLLVIVHRYPPAVGSQTKVK